MKAISASGQSTFSHTERTEDHTVFFWAKRLLQILFTSSAFGGLSPDPISSIAGSPK
jgi:hypothetical protein